jgi:hypothetical protein
MSGERRQGEGKPDQGCGNQLSHATLILLREAVASMGQPAQGPKIKVYEFDRHYIGMKFRKPERA